MFVGIGTLVNCSTVALGSTVGILAGHRLPDRTRTVVTDGLGLVTLLIAALSAIDVTDGALSAKVGDSAPVLIVLGSVLLGGITGSLLRLEDRLEGLGGVLQRYAARHLRAGDDTASRERFIEGYVTASLIFCVGPLTILGSLTEGLGDGPQTLFLKSGLDGFAAIAFAAAFGWGVFASVLSVLTIQGSLTVIGVFLGSFLPDAQIDALSAVGGLLLVGQAIRLLDLKRVRVADLLPALVFAPVLVSVVAAFR